MKYTYAFCLLLPALTGQAQVIHQIEVEDNEFDPPSLTINAGDIVSIVWDDDILSEHSLIQVDASTWISNGTTPLPGGFQLGDGTPTPGHAHTIVPTANVWYVCGFHAAMGMKGTITVIGGTNAIEEAEAQGQFRFAPNPASEGALLIAPDSRHVFVQLTDAAGRTCLSTSLMGGHELPLADLVPGAYMAAVRDAEGTLLTRERLLITH